MAINAVRIHMPLRSAAKYMARGSRVHGRGDLFPPRQRMHQDGVRTEQLQLLQAEVEAGDVDARTVPLFSPCPTRPARRSCKWRPPPGWPRGSRRCTGARRLCCAGWPGTSSPFWSGFGAMKTWRTFGVVGQQVKSNGPCGRGPGRRRTHRASRQAADLLEAAHQGVDVQQRRVGCWSWPEPAG